MIKSILIAIDDSASSRSALDVAVEIGKLTQAKLKGLYIEDALRLGEWRPLVSAGTKVTSSSQQSSREQLDLANQLVEEGDKLEKLFESRKKEAHLEGYFSRTRGLIDEMVIEAAKTVDLVVIGRRGTEMGEYSNEPGPTTENLLRKTTKPVIVVPPGGKLSKNILIAYDGSETAQRALSTGAKFATLLKSPIEVICVSEEEVNAGKNLVEAREFLAPYKLETCFEHKTGSFQPSYAIREEALKLKAGLIALGAFGPHKLLELVFGSTTKSVIMQSTCPVLLCR